MQIGTDDIENNSTRDGIKIVIHLDSDLRLKLPFNTPVWASAFRPFYLLGAWYAPLLIAVWLGAWSGLWILPPQGLSVQLVHGHEFIFGFSAAIITGIVLTALPSWAGIKEIQGARLALLVGLWLAGRIAFWAFPWLPPLFSAIVDGLLLPVIACMLLPQLLRASNRLYLWLLPILLTLCAANLAFYHGMATGNPAQASAALRLAIYTLIVLYVVKGGVLVPIFTGNALRQKGRGQQATFVMLLDWTAVGAVALLAAFDLLGAPPGLTGTCALACALLHGWRCARWRGWRVADVPLVLVMHLGFTWLLLAFLLKGLTDLTGLVPAAAWLHAFTLGSLGMMMLGLMTRVSLHHTGRPLTVPPTMLLAYVLMFVAALLRVAVATGALGHWAVTLSALLWMLPFVLFLLTFSAALLGPSLPRAPAPA